MTGAFGDGIPIPDVIDPTNSMTMTLCIPRNRDHMAAFFGALYQLTIWNSWQQDGTTHGKELAAVWWRYFLSWDRTMNELECEDGMNNCCTEPAIIKRVNPTTGNVEQSTDDGLTWTPVAGGFQSVIVSPVPPVTSGVAGTNCDAASNVAGQINVWISQVTTDFDTAITLLEFAIGVLEAILLAVLAVLSAGALTPLEAAVLPTIGAAAAAAYGAGKTAFVAYWTADIKHKIKCAAYCTISADGSFTASQFSQFWNKVNTELPPSPAKMLFMGFLSSVGQSGLNAMAASGMSAGTNCADCACTDECMTVWTFFGLTDVVKVDDNHYTGNYAGGGVHVAFTSGDSAVGCYFAQPLGSFSYWPIGSGSPVGGTNPRLTAIWNADFGLDYTTGQPLTFEFSSNPIP